MHTGCGLLPLFKADSEEIATMVKPTTGFEEVVNAYRLRSIASISGLSQRRLTLWSKPTKGFTKL
jgi:hypothetical protein